MPLSWLLPTVLERVRESLRRGLSSWDDLFEADRVCAGAPPDGVAVSTDAWPRLAAHVARAERVREVVALRGLDAARRRFAASPHAIERAALLEAQPSGTDMESVAGVLACDIDEYVVYGQFLSRLVELGMGRDPVATVAAFERFVAAASEVVTDQPSWPERLRVARDGLAALYTRVGRLEDAHAAYRARFDEEHDDATVAISAARAFLEAGDVSRAVAWLDHGARRARDIGRSALARRLSDKARVLRARLN